MIDTSTTEVAQPLAAPQEENTESSQNVPQRHNRLKHVARMADPRRVLEHFSKKDQEKLTPEQKKAFGLFASGMALIKEHGVDAATFIVPAVIATLPIILGAPGIVTDIAQETAIGATGALMGVDVGKTVRAVNGESGSKKASVVDAALGAATMMGVGHAAHAVGGDTFRAGVALADEPLAPPVRLAARAIKKGIEGRRAKATLAASAEPVGQK